MASGLRHTNGETLIHARPRAREAGLLLGRLPPGPGNSITDVEGVAVGHATLSDGANQTGVTVVVPHPGNIFQDKVIAAAHVINGFGKAVGLSQIAELGVIETPIALTNTLAVGAVFEGLVVDALRRNPEICLTGTSVNPVVAECNDSRLNQIRSLAVRPEHLLAALASASPGVVEEGSVGAGTGMVCYGWKGGIGTASRVVVTGDERRTIGVLVLANFGRSADLMISGVSVGRHLHAPALVPSTEDADGSCVVIVATDAALDSRQLGRVARRVQSGLARTGTYTAHGSGDYAFVFSTVRSSHREAADGSMSISLESARSGGNSPAIDAFFQATVEATEEAVVNALFTARTTVGRDDNRAEALPTDEVVRLISRGSSE